MADISFDDLIPKTAKAPGTPKFDDLIPKQPAPTPTQARPAGNPYQRNVTDRATGALAELDKVIADVKAKPKTLANVPKVLGGVANYAQEAAGAALGGAEDLISRPVAAAYSRMTGEKNDPKALTDTVNQGLGLLAGGEGVALRGKAAKVAAEAKPLAEAPKFDDLIPKAKPIAAKAEADELFADLIPRKKKSWRSNSERGAPKVARKGPLVPPDHPPGDVIGNEADHIERIDNAFFRAGGRASTGKLDADQAVRGSKKGVFSKRTGGLPKEIRNAQVQEDLTHAIEERMLAPPKVAGKLKDTRGQGVQYHGSKAPVESLHEGYYSPDNIYGGYDTFYTTDAADIAGGYGRKNPSAAIHKVEEIAPVRHYDMEQPHDADHWNNVFGAGPEDLSIESEAIDNAVQEHGKPNLRQVMDEIRAISRDHGYTKDDVQEIFSGVTQRLEKDGYGGMAHTGGLKTGKAPHTVKIYFRPWEQLKLTKVDPEREQVAGEHPPLPEHLQEAEAARQPWAERQRAAVNEIRQRLQEQGLSEEDIEDYAPSSETGYVPRRVVGHSPGLDARDPQAEGRNPLAWKSNPLQKSTSSLKARTHMVWEDQATGKRYLTDDAVKAGDVHPEEEGLVAKPATIKEIEAGTDTRYHKNAFVNTVDEALRAERVLDNLKVLDETTKAAQDAGLAHRAEWRFKDESGAWRPVRANSQAPEGFREIEGVPALKGWTFDPKLHQLLTDVLPKKPEPFQDTIATVNRAINASLFVTPIPHIKNVGTMAFIGRGWDNFNPAAYPRAIRTSAQAIKQVMTLGPEYKAWLREGAALQAGDEATRNFYEGMLKAFGSQVEKDPSIAKRLGMAPADLVKSIYKISHTALWNVNDMMMFQRYLELKEKGMSARAAIKETERWVANYRVPPQVMKSRAAQQLFTNGIFVNFGRYDYGKLKALGELVKRAKSDPLDAAGKVAALGFLGMIAYPLMDKAAKKLTGNDNAYVPRGGELGTAEGILDTAANQGGRQEGDFYASARENNEAGLLASILTPSPSFEAAGELSSGKYGWSGQPIVDPNASPAGQTAQKLEYGASKFYPAQLGLSLAKPGGVANSLAALSGASTPATSGGMKGSTAARLRAQAKSREKRDPVEQWLGQ